MKKKILALLVAVPLCMVLIAMPFSASAASTTIQYGLGNDMCYGTLSNSQSAYQEPTATAITRFTGAADHTEAYVSITIRWGADTITRQAENESSGSSISAFVNSGYAGGVFASAKGTHYVSAGVGRWGPANTNL